MSTKIRYWVAAFIAFAFVLACVALIWLAYDAVARNVRRYKLNTDLAITASLCDTERVAWLLKQGAAVNFQEDGTPLYYAANSGCRNIVAQLLAAGADPNLGSKLINLGETPLMVAAANGDVVSTRALLDHGAEVNRADARGRTALMVACLYAQPECVKLLLDRGANSLMADNRGNTAWSITLSGPRPDAEGPGWPGEDRIGERIRIFALLVGLLSD